MTQIFTVIAPLFLIILAGAVLHRTRAIGDNWQSVLNEYALKVGFPVLIFTSLTKAPFSFEEQGPLIIANSLFILTLFLTAIIAGKILRLSGRMTRTVFICLVFGNVAYLGIPILVQVAGEKILPSASLIVAVYLFWNFTVGIAFLDLTRTENKKNILKDVAQNLLKNPLLIAVFLGLIVATLNVRLPHIVTAALNMITASVTPVVLIVIGLFIGSSTIGKVSDWLPVFLFSCIVLIAKPAVLYFGVHLFGFSTADFSFSVIEAAMPLAITPFALADLFDMDKEFIARGIVLSTILSIVTLPFWIVMM
jgi:predicted permease